MADYAIGKADTDNMMRTRPLNEYDYEVSIRDRNGLRTLALCSWRDARLIVAALEMAEERQP